MSGVLSAKFKEFILFNAKPSCNVFIRLLAHLLLEMNVYYFNAKINKDFLKSCLKYSLMVFEDLI